MKTCTSYVTLALACLAVFFSWSGCSTTDKTGWRVLQQSTYGSSFSYDAGSLKRTSADTLTVWAEANGGKYQYELDCRNKKARILEGPGTTVSAWFGIVGNSGDALLYNEVCH